jgi:hypothetical protein
MRECKEEAVLADVGRREAAVVLGAMDRIDGSLFQVVVVEGLAVVSPRQLLSQAEDTGQVCRRSLVVRR